MLITGKNRKSLNGEIGFWYTPPRPVNNVSYQALTGKGAVKQETMLICYTIWNFDLWSKVFHSWYGSGHEGVAVLLPGFAINW